MLKNKTAVLYGVSDSLMGAIAKTFAAQGARVFLTGRSLQKVEKVVAAIREAGGRAEAAQVDAMDEEAVQLHLQGVLQKTGRVDVSFNGIGLSDTQNIPLTQMTLEDFIRPIYIGMQSQFITATAAGRIMAEQGSGVILSLSSTPGALGYPLVGGFGPACCALEGFAKHLATELGSAGVRVLSIRSAGSPDSRPFKEGLRQNADLMRGFITKLEADTMLKQLPLMADVANVAAFLASDLAGKLTGITVDVTAGTSTGLNYKTSVIPLVS